MAKFKFPWDNMGNFIEVEAKTRQEAVDKVFGLCQSMADAIVGEIEKEGSYAGNEHPPKAHH